MRKILALIIAVFVLAIPLVACNNTTGFTERDARPITVVRNVPDGFISLTEIMYLIREVDEHVTFFVWKNQTGIIDSSRRLGDERHKFAFDTHIQDRRFVVNLTDGSTYVYLQTFLDFLEMLEIQIEKPGYSANVEYIAFFRYSRQ